MVQCTHCGAWSNEEICPYCDCPMPVKRREPQNSYKADNEAEPAQSSFVPLTNRRIIALFLCFFGGYFGLHNFYVGRIGRGILYVFTVGIFGFGWIYDLILILCGVFKDKDGNYL